jgi:hypothetical protein
MRGTRKPGRPEMTPDDLVEPPAREPGPPGVDEDGIVGSHAGKNEWPERSVSPPGERHEARLAALAAAHQETVGSNVFAAQVEEFGRTKPGGNQDLEDCLVTLGETRLGEKPVELFVGEEAGKRRGTGRHGSLSVRPPRRLAAPRPPRDPKRAGQGRAATFEGS